MLPDKLFLLEKGAGDFGWGTQVGSTQESENEVGPISGLVWSLSHSVPREGRGLVLGSHLKNKPNKAEVARTGSGKQFVLCLVAVRWSTNQQFVQISTSASYTQHWNLKSRISRF